jgi:LemA protein
MEGKRRFGVAGMVGIGCLVVIILLALFIILPGFFSYNKLVNLDEGVNGSWSEVENSYQRRNDLIPNLVETVKGYAKFERETLEAVIQARANATRPNIDAKELANNPELQQQFIQTQENLGQALGRLLVVVERYPDLKANQNFIRLQDELAGTENRIAVARRRFIETVQEYNRAIRRFPVVIVAGLMGFEKRAYFETAPEAKQAPKVDFNK